MIKIKKNKNYSKSKRYIIKEKDNSYILCCYPKITI